MDTKPVPKEQWSDMERKTRIELAAAYRMVAHYGWSELVYNHLTARIPGTDFILLNPFGLGFEEITASSLVKIDLHSGNIVDPGTTEYGINSDTVAVASMKEGLIEDLCQNTMICGEISYHDYEGISVNEEEEARIQKDLGNTSMNLFLRNHGILTCGTTVQEAMFRLFLLVKACEIQVRTLSAVGGDISKLQKPAADTRYQARNVSSGFTKVGFGVKEFDYMIRVIDRIDPSYKD
ncbi:hypothetical protein SAMD00019534_066860 [Acytostelium subglobosum LB1]|uniref:hypothetical protein n=1 Tax=Acytostelium subglobosum LB1 TaxID=1410327 RepID=UPI000644F552|nr:hypothetical protein SAMD00019534_066860 [Acytostelium subglobosum LB1]GAM23511.1 hypothetical protein SAMD00019534_066860 [Acytostelium subglobosum LB1]|eukprot:XP_012753252.1 hypothetical protein SAMD00019534_066860 [Acytostelium subglobosum LB1]